MNLPLKLSFLFTICLVGQSSRAQNFQWAGSIEGHGVYSFENNYPGSSRCTAMAVDAMESIYIAGSFNDTIDLDFGPSTALLSSPFPSFFLAKYNTGGHLVWGTVLAGSEPAYMLLADMAVDRSGNIVITGQSTCALDMDPGPGISELQLLPGNSSYFFLAKYTPQGNLIWAESIGAQPASIAVDPFNDLLVMGKYYNDVDMNPGAAADTLHGNGASIFFAKYASDGTYLWANGLSHVGSYATPGCIKVNEEGEIFISGTYANTVDFDPGPGVVELTSMSWIADYFFAKYDPNGNLIWAHGLRSAGQYDKDGLQLAWDSIGNIYVSGEIAFDLDLDPGPAEMFIAPEHYACTFLAKYTPNAEPLWGKLIPGAFTPRTLLIDAHGDIRLAGTTAGGDFDPGPGVVWLATPPSAFADFFAKYDSDGNYCWAGIISNNGYGGSVSYPSYAVHGDHQYMAGSFRTSPTDFDPGPGSFILTPSANGFNGYLGRYDGESFTLDLGPDHSGCEGEVLLLDPALPGASILWQDGSTAPSFTVTESGTYWAVATTPDCPRTDTIHVEIRDCTIALDMPNVFSPNGDGVNDRFLPIRIHGITSATLQVRNRWGQLVYQTSDLEVGWDGHANSRRCSAGVYYWTIRYVDSDMARGEQHGQLTLLGF